MKWRVLIFYLCFAAAAVLAGPFKPKPYGPPVNLHLCDVIFFPPIAPAGSTTYLLTELQTTTNLSSQTWDAVCWFPGNGQWATVTFSNNMDSMPHFYRTATFGTTQPISNPMIFIRSR